MGKGTGPLSKGNKQIITVSVMLERIIVIIALKDEMEEDNAI